MNTGEINRELDYIGLQPSQSQIKVRKLLKGLPDCKVNFSSQRNKYIMFIIIFFAIPQFILPSESWGFNLERPSLRSLENQDNTKFWEYYSYFASQCDYRTEAQVGVGNYHNNCLLTELIVAYLDNSLILEGSGTERGLLETSFQTRRQWTTIDLMAGYFNEKLAFSTDSYMGVKPIINRIVLEVAIRKELVKFKSFLEQRREVGAWKARRYFYPELMAHFGGQTVISRVHSYEKSMVCVEPLVCPEDNPSCEYGVQCSDDNDCGTYIQNECKATKNALKSVQRSAVQGQMENVQRVLNDYRELVTNPAFTASQVLFEATENFDFIFEEIEQKVDGSTILIWVRSQEPCDFSQENPIEVLCNRIDQSLVFPKNLLDKTVSDALMATAVLWEVQKVNKAVESYEITEIDLERYSGLPLFIDQASTEVVSDLEEAFNKLKLHFGYYDPTSADNRTSTGGN